jgi:uncharacterized protein (TIGR02147 family)
MQKSLDDQLLAANDYRSFLREAFAVFKRENPKFSYALFSRKAGLLSKSYPRDVSLGRRRLTLASTASFSKALELSAESKAIFELLVAKEEKSVRPPGWDEHQVQARLEKLKIRSERKKQKSVHTEQKTFPEFRHWFEVYAALGTKELGASLEQIVSRTRSKKSICESVLQSMTAFGACIHDPKTNRYKPLSLNPLFEGLGKNPLFQSWFLHCLDLTKTEATNRFSSDQALFLGSALSIQSHKLPLLKKKLQEVVFQFIEDSEVSEGDRVAHVVAAIF